ncbi:MAG: hypothetical protein RRY62_12085 [Chryseobacterium sp.]
MNSAVRKIVPSYFFLNKRDDFPPHTDCFLRQTDGIPDITWGIPWVADDIQFIEDSFP